jgi:glycosyltransferase involved in cell wall biosynthesis
MSTARQSTAGNEGGICFVAPNAFPVLAGDRINRVVGGAEVQQSLLAREFAARGHRTSMICMDFGQPDGLVVDGVTVYKMHSLHAGLPVLRFIHPRMTSLWSAMRRARASVYYQRGAGALTGQVVAFARRQGAATLFAGAHEDDFDPALPQIPFARDRAICRWGTRHVDAIVTQTDQQQEACRQVLQRESSVIRSCGSSGGAPGRRDGPVLWVGRVIPWKRPLDVVEIARRNPKLRFKIVGDGDQDLMARLRAAAAELDNLEVVGFVPFVDVGACFDGASALINTSISEGFPNTFLQAWSRGIPSLSYFDPRTQIDGRRVGEVHETIDALALAVGELCGDPVRWQLAAADARSFAEQNFAVERAVDAYERLIRTIPAAKWSSRITTPAPI